MRASCSADSDGCSQEEKIDYLESQLSRVMVSLGRMTMDELISRRAAFRRQP